MTKLQKTPFQAPFIVMYHYVQNTHANNKGMHPCSIQTFEKQINFLSNNYNIVSVQDVLEATKKNIEPNIEPMCAVTFDDGLKDQFVNAVPILDRFNVKATFYIITATLEGFLPTTHKLHILLSRVSGEDLNTQTNLFIKNNYPSLSKQYYAPIDVRLNNKRSRFDSIPTANFKEIVTILPKNTKTELLEHLFFLNKIEMMSAITDLFMTAKMIKQLSVANHTIGSHSHDHEAFDTLSDDDITTSIKKSINILQNDIAITPNNFCYPQGEAGKNGVQIINKLGFTNAVSVKTGCVTSNTDAYNLPRVDTTLLHNYTSINAV